MEIKKEENKFQNEIWNKVLNQIYLGNSNNLIEPKDELVFDLVLGQLLSRVFRFFQSIVSDETFWNSKQELFLQFGLMPIVVKPFYPIDNFSLFEKLSHVDKNKRIITPFFPQFKQYFNIINKFPVEGLFENLFFLIWENRLLRRFLRKRFRIKIKSGKRIQEKKFRKRDFNQLGEQKESISHSKSIDVPKTAYEENLLNYALLRLSEIQIKLEFWKLSICEAHEKLCNSQNLPDFWPKDFAQDVIETVKPKLEDFEFKFNETLLQQKDKRKLDYEWELIYLSASLANKISLTTNRRLTETLKGEDRPFKEILLKRIPAAVILCILDESENLKSKKSRKETTLINRVVNLLTKDLPLETKHNNRRKRQIRDKSISSEELITPRQKNIPEIEDFSLNSEQEFALREEARIDLNKIIKSILNAPISPSQLQVWWLMKIDGLTEREISQHLGLSIGTIRSHLARAKAKIKSALKNFIPKTKN
ncbi:MAG: sigma-70 family RNA polymerase sigma factor [Pyrinomonadaceae bacterium]